MADGLVDRVTVAGDRRAFRVLLTVKGRKAFNEMALRHADWVVEAFASLSDSEMATLHGLLGKVKEQARSAAGAGR